MRRVDYDLIAHHYDEPLRDHTVDPHLVAFLEAADDETAATLRILDIGCGTGRQLAANRARLPHVSMIGVDRFQAMLRIARNRCSDVRWLQADGAALPLTSMTCDYVTSQFAYPHVRNTRRLVAEIFRVLRPGGRFVMTNIDPWSMPGWSIYRYFPEALALDREDFVPVDAFIALLGQSGFREVRPMRRNLPTEERLEDFLAFASERHRASQLMAIPNAAYSAGLQRLQEAARDAPDGQATFVSELVLVTIAADRPRAPA